MSLIENDFPSNNTNINLTDLNDLIAKIDFVNGFLETNLPKIDEIINKLENSSIFKQNINDLKENLNENLQILKSLTLSFENELKEFSNTKDKLNEINSILKEIAISLSNIKITIKKDTLNDINNSISSLVKEIKEKEKKEIDKMLEEIAKITQENKSNIQKLKDLSIELGLIQKTKIFSFLGGIITGLLICALVKFF